MLGVEPAPAAAPVVSDAEKDLQPRMLTTLDRVNEIDAALPTAPEADREALQAERANLTKDWPSAVPGALDDVLHRGRRQAGRAVRPDGGDRAPDLA